MTSKDRIENAIRHIQTATDIDPWAMEIAVEAMKAQLSEEGTTNGTTFDSISRQAAMDAFTALIPYAIDDAVTEAYAHGLSDGYNVICNLPSAQPERKKGKWLIRRGIADAQCSECKMYFRDVYDMENSDAFCRHCGTKMEGLKVVEDE